MHFKEVFKVTNHSFNEVAIKLFLHQAQENEVYRTYLKLIRVNPQKVSHYLEIPFLPIQFFKSHRVSSIKNTSLLTFESSATTGIQTSKHHVFPAVYHLSMEKSFEFAFKSSPKDYCILALLPGYLERSNSSLVYMVNRFIEQSKYEGSGFYLNDHEALHQKLNQLQKDQTPTLLFGVSFALLDFIDQFKIANFPELTVIETGGMKGRKKELTKNALHQILSRGFPHSSITSEYGMTEMLSQCYAHKQTFSPPPWYKVIPRSLDNPFETLPAGKTGGLNFIDLANTGSCSFIATDDLAKVNKDGTFEVLGRIDHSDIRGCSLLVSG